MPEEIFYVWCDGSYSVTHRRGAWGAVIVSSSGYKKECAGVMPECTTSSEAELWSILKALQELPDCATVKVMCDCLSVVNGIQNLLIPLRIGKPIPPLPAFIEKHVDWIRWMTMEVCRLKSIQVEWVKGHGDDPHNRRADILARESLRKSHHVLKYQKPPLNWCRFHPHWRTYVTPINIILVDGYYHVKRGDAGNVTKKLCCEQVLDASYPYDPDIPERMPNELQIYQAAEELNIVSRTILSDISCRIAGTGRNDS